MATFKQSLNPTTQKKTRLRERIASQISLLFGLVYLYQVGTLKGNYNIFKSVPFIYIYIFGSINELCSPKYLEIVQ